ncbi:MAG: hypothetical protein V1851_01240 [Patescibacteria group bacterium]
MNLKNKKQDSLKFQSGFTPSEIFSSLLSIIRNKMKKNLFNKKQDSLKYQTGFTPSEIFIKIFGNIKKKISRFLKNEKQGFVEYQTGFTLSVIFKNMINFLKNKTTKIFKDKKVGSLKFQTGFTLIETFVAVTVLLIAITGPLYLVAKGLSVSKSAKNQVTAMYLAQEAVEYIRNIRDENILKGQDWLTGLDYCLNGSKCAIDSPQEEILLCSGVCNFLKYDEDKYLYTYSSGTASPFRREISLLPIGNTGTEVEILVDMYWNDGPNQKDFEVREHLLNWQ